MPEPVAQTAIPFPHPMPFGWYGVALSEDIEAGQSLGIRYFGQDLVLFRGQNGCAHVLDAYCPHLGANLGVGVGGEPGAGAEVRDNTLVCPFHAWRFNGDGECVEVPYATNMPPKAAGKRCLKSWPTREHNGVVWVWYHPGDVAPLWDAARFEPPDAPDWSRVAVRRWRLRTHVQEMAENGADTAHFLAVHKVADFPAPEYMRYEGHEYEARIVNYLDTPQGAVPSTFHLYNCGPGQTYTWFTGLCETFQLGIVTPVEPGLLDVTFVFFQPELERREKAGLAKAWIEQVGIQIEQDSVIWEHKRYVPNPILCDGDGPIAKFRKWYRQFYV